MTSLEFGLNDPMKLLRFLIMLPFVLSACSSPSTNDDFQLSDLLEKGSWVDLSHSFNSNTIYWPTVDSHILFVNTGSSKL